MADSGQMAGYLDTALYVGVGVSESGSLGVWESGSLGAGRLGGEGCGWKDGWTNVILLVSVGFDLTRCLILEKTHPSRYMYHTK